MSYTFDCDNKIIQLTSTGELDMRDLYSRWKDEVISSIAGCEQSIRVIKEPLAGSTSLGPYYFMMNDWQIRPVDSVHELVVSGSVLQDTTSSVTPFKLDNLTNIVSIVRTVAVDVQVVETPAAESAADIADAVWDEAYADHKSAGTFGKLMDTLRKSNLAMDGEITANPTTTSFDTDLVDPTGTHDHQVLLFVSGTLAGQSQPIETFTNGVNNTVVLQEPLTSTPSIGDEFVILPQHVHPVSEIQSGLATSAEVAAVPDNLIAKIV